MTTFGEKPFFPESKLMLDQNAEEVRQLLSAFSVNGAYSVPARCDGDNDAKTFQEGRYRALLDLCPVTVWIADSNGQTIYTNRHWEEYSGLTAEQSQGHGWMSCIHPEDQAQCAEVWSRRSAAVMYEQEIRFRRRDGQYLWHLAKAVPIVGSQGETLCWMGVCVDIHDRKVAQLAVAEAEEHMRFTLEAAGVGSCGFYPCSEKKEWSGRSADMLGVAREQEPKLEIFMSRVHPDDRQRVWETVGAVLQSPVTQDYDFDYRIVRPDGEVRWLLSRGKYFVPPAGSSEEPRMKGILLDITDRKRSEEEKKKLEEQLLLARKMEAVGRLASGVAHDFNNLITVIAGAADRMQERLANQTDAQDLLNIIHDAANHASGLTGQLLAFGRRQVLHPVPLCLNETLCQFEHMLRRLAGEDIIFKTQFQQDLWRVKMDPVQLEQILLNLAGNARDAMPNGGVITVKTSNCTVAADGNGHALELPPGDYVCLTFSDNGIGMDAEVRSHLFEPFYTTKEFGRGTGLGLSTVYGIVQQSGGHISVHSEPGQGSEFLLYLPRTVEAVQPAAGTNRGKTRADGVNGSEHVLLVEDEPSLREILAEHLREHGYVVHEAANAIEAGDLANRHNIELLITDMVMPGDNGLQVAESLAKEHPGLPTIFISGYSESEAVQGALVRPDTYYLQKPFRVHHLLAKIREVLPSRNGVNR